MPVTPEVEVPPKASTDPTEEPKDVINVDDLPEVPTAESGKGASSSHTPSKETGTTSAQAPASDAEKKLQTYSSGSGMPPIQPQNPSTTTKIPLVERYEKISEMMGKVWGDPATKKRDLSALEADMKEFFASHLIVRQQTRKLHEALKVHILEQKAEIELLRKRDAESQEAISMLEARAKETEERRPSIDKLSAELEVLKTEHASLQEFLKKSSEKETKERMELEKKHAREMAELAEEVQANKNHIKTLLAKAKAYTTEAEAIDNIIFPCLGFEWPSESPLDRVEAYEEARDSIDGLFEACREIAKCLSLKKARTTVIDTMTKLMGFVPELIRDWQASSAGGAASIVLAMCKAHFPSMNFASVVSGAPKATNLKAILAETKGFDHMFAERLDHSFWYQKHAPPLGFSETEDDDEEETEEGSGSSASRSDADSGDSSDKDDTYDADEDDAPSSE